MRNIAIKITGFGILVLGIIMAPLFPFWGLLLVPLVLLVFGLPASALLFSLLLDSFLVPGGVGPMWVSLTFYVVFCIPLYAYIRYTTTL